jgi:hypothetical protein
VLAFILLRAISTPFSHIKQLPTLLTPLSQLREGICDLDCETLPGSPMLHPLWHPPSVRNPSNLVHHPLPHPDLRLSHP